jgi:tRNA-dihydrouridine synthase
MVTEFVSAEGIIQADERTRVYTEFEDEQKPVGVQLFGADGPRMAEAAKKIIDWKQPDFIDINFGCPVKKVVSRNGGSSLLKNCPVLAEVASSIAKGVGDRAAMHYPWIFRDAKYYLKTGEQPPPVPLEERWELILRHASMLIEWGKFSAEKFAIQSLRSRLMAYSKGLPAGKTLRTRFSTVNSLCELEDIAEEYLSRSLSAEPAIVSSASPIS